MDHELISRKTRTEFREFFVGSTLREIQDEFDSARIPCDLGYSPTVSGQRRSLVEQYYHSLNFKNPYDVKRILVVFENALIAVANRQPAYGQAPSDCKSQNTATVERLASWLQRDGYEFKNGRICHRDI